MSRKLPAALLTFLVSVFSGCGSAGKHAPFSTDEVERQFFERTRDRLMRSELPARLNLPESGFDLLGNGGTRVDDDGKTRIVDPRPDLERKYGNFDIRVWKTEKQARNAPGSREKLVPGKLYWEYAPPDMGPRYWVATKLYENVELTWFSDRPGVDARWGRLDRVLSALR